MLKIEVQTLAQTYEKFSSGEDFRETLGNFMNSFFLYHVKQRQELLDAIPQLPESLTDEQHPWIAFVAGAAEYLAKQYRLVCPEWAMKPAYVLDDPWYAPACDVYPGLKAEFLESTPEPFRKRNVFCGDRVFSNPHRSSREPGSFQDLQRRRKEMLKHMPQEDREEFVARYNAHVPKRLRISA